MSMIHKALEYAASVHDGQKRKGTSIPYIVHPAEVMYYLTLTGAPEHVIVAGILHDTVEDTSASPEDILELFGTEVAQLVLIETEDKTKTWHQRKEATLERLRDASAEARLICCADKLCNLKSIFFDLQSGHSVWERFKGTRQDTMQHCLKLKEVLSPLEDNIVYAEFLKYLYLVFPEAQTIK